MSGPKISYANLDPAVYGRQSERAMFDFNVDVCCKYADIVLPLVNRMDQISGRLDAVPCFEEDVEERENIMRSIAEFKSRNFRYASDVALVKEYKAADSTKRRMLQDRVPSFEKKYAEAKYWKRGAYSRDLFFVEHFNETLSRNAGKVASEAQALARRIEKWERTATNRKIDKNLESDTYYFSFENATKVYSAGEFVERINNTMNEISEMELSKKLEKKVENLKQKASEIQNGEFIHNFYQISVVPFYKECKEYNDFYVLHHEEYESLKINCELLAKELNETVEEKELSQEAIDYYRSKREELSERAIESRKQEYIKQCMDEAMEELGYNLVGSKSSVNRRGEMFHNQLFSYGEGTVVNVTFANNGQITMELGGVDTSDRLPEYAESQKLVEAMHTFCSDYTRIEEKLKEKGVINERVSMMPADDDYAQIINISEYEMNQEVTKFEAHKQSSQQTQYMHQGGSD